MMIMSGHVLLIAIGSMKHCHHVVIKKHHLNAILGFCSVIYGGENTKNRNTNSGLV